MAVVLTCKAGQLIAAELPAKNEAVNSAMHSLIHDNEIAGAVTLVATHDKILHLDAAGSADVEAKQPMASDTIFWIASMTKPVTGAAVMMLVDEGKISLDDPVSKYLPEMKELKTKDGEPANVTIKQCMMHTSGIGDFKQGEAPPFKTLAEATPLYAKLPMQFNPGQEWKYCQSGINTAARVVEVVSGKPFDQFLQERLFSPLGMRDTTFYLSAEQLPRLAKSYERTKEERLAPATIKFLAGKSATDRDRMPAANGGLFSTAADYARFCQMILNKGQLDGKRYLSEKAVAQMTSVQSGDLRTGFTPGNGWGIGWCVVREPEGVTAMLSPGTHGHGGAYGTQAWIDPVRDRIYLLLVQRSNFANSDGSPARKIFQEAAAKQ